MTLQGQTIQQISVDQLEPNPLQPRDISSDSLDELMDSIKRYGVLEPLVAHTPAGYRITSGERRWRAPQSSRFETVPAIVKDTTPMGMLEMAIIKMCNGLILMQWIEPKHLKNYPTTFICLQPRLQNDYG